jgi:type II secretory pathway pseudopilin PulG
LVVIAIIAILAAILFPVFASAKAAAKSAACMSNMRQIGFAARLYLNDNDDVWFPSLTASSQPGFAPQQPWIGFDNNNAPVNGGIYGNVDLPPTHPPQPGIIDPYLRSDAIKKCPALPSGWQTGYAINGFSASSPSDYYTTNPAAAGNEYGPSSKLQTFPNGYMVSVPASDSEVEEPADTMILWEHQASAPYCNFLQQYDWLSQPPNLDVPRNHFHFLHGQGSNTLWADSHSKKLVYGQLRRPMFSSRKDIYPGS